MNGDPSAFNDTCLLASLVLGKWFLDVEKFPSPQRSREVELRENAISYYLKNTSKFHVGTYLKKDIMGLAQELKIDSKGPHTNRNHIIQRVAQLWNVQIFVWTQHSPAKISFMFPEQWNVSLPAIHLLLTVKGDLQNDHIDLIKTLEMFWNVRGMTCPACKKTVKNFHNTRHRCNSIQSCYACHRFLQTEETLLSTKSAFMFCDGRMSKPELFSKNCPHCNSVFKSLNCKKSHKKAICAGSGYYCSKCNHSDAGITKIVKEQHMCRTNNICPHCWTEAKENHICPWGTPRLPLNFPNLGFVHWKTTSCQSRCVDCFAQDTPVKMGLCQLHQVLETETHKEVIYAGVAVEHKTRETFQKFCLKDSMFSQTESPAFEEKVQYLPDPLAIGRDMQHLDFARKTGRYGKSVKTDAFLESALANLAQKPNKTVVENLICQLVSPRFRNYTFVLSSDSHLQQLVKAMVENDFQMDSSNIIVKGTTVILLPVSSLGIAFISAAEFLDASFSDLHKQLGLGDKRPFFPDALSHRTCFAFNHPTIPVLNHFLDLSDSSELAKEKTAFWESRQEQSFNLQQSLEEVCLSELDIHLKSCLSLLRTSFEFEIRCRDAFGKPLVLEKKHAPLLHLFAFVSLGSFVHDCFRLFSLDKGAPLYSIMPTKKDNVSLGELEYTSYLSHCHPGQYITAFSSNKGQKRITAKGQPTVIPDAYGTGMQEGVLHFFNGCWYDE